MKVDSEFFNSNKMLFHQSDAFSNKLLSSYTSDHLASQIFKFKAHALRIFAIGSV